MILLVVGTTTSGNNDYDKIIIIIREGKRLSVLKIKSIFSAGILHV